MNYIKSVFLLAALLLIISCKKEVEQPICEPKPDPVLAPCDLPEDFFYSEHTDTLKYIGNYVSNMPDLPYENCHYYVRLKTGSPNVKTHLYFREEPKSGIYIPAVAMNLDTDTTFAIRHDYGGLNFIPHASGDVAYVNNQDGVITVSYCFMQFKLDITNQVNIVFSNKFKFNK